MRNPLNRRLPRSFLKELPKNLAVCILMIIIIGFVSGTYVANRSMSAELASAYDKYIREDGHFALEDEADADLIAAIEEGKIADIKQYIRDEAQKEIDDTLEDTVKEECKKEIDSQLEAAYGEVSDDLKEAAYEEFFASEEYEDILEEAKTEAAKEIEDTADEKYEELAEDLEIDGTEEPIKVTVTEMFYKDTTEDDSSKVRVYKLRDEMNLLCLMEGEYPKTNDEIAIDRMHADNAGYEVGDKIKIGDKEYTITALVAATDYTTLYENNSDIMFDALTFDVVFVTDEAFDEVDARCVYNYSWRYDSGEPATDIEASDKSSAFLKVLLSQTIVFENDMEDYLPAYLNQAIIFAPDDIGSDLAMSGVLLYIFIVVLGFVFAVTTSSTIEREAGVIGTLRATGYTRGEITVHYLGIPVLITFVSAVIGNVLGYTVFKNLVVYMYFNSYSLPTYTTVPSGEALLKTTVIPIILVILVNLIIITKKLRLSPLRFLRHDLSTVKRKKAVRLPRWRFLARFRLRVFLQNIPNYILIFAGIFFIMVLLAFAVGAPESLDYYKNNVADMLFCNYQTVLTDTEDEDGNPIETDTPGAEKAVIDTLVRKDTYSEDVSVYAVEDDSRYITLEGDGIFISSAYAQKFGTAAGDTITLSEKYENKSYDFDVAGIYTYDGAVAIFMPTETYTELFGEDEDYFNAYFSDEEITDIDDDYIAAVITRDDITKVADQLDHSMGDFMTYLEVLCIGIAVILIYLITKLVIEKNEKSIAMAKILGFETGEIASIYLTATTIVAIISSIVAAYLGFLVINVAWRVMILEMAGWLEFLVTPEGYARMILWVIAAYLVVMLIDFNRIRKIPKDEALKNVE